jgi:hypothetical protein
MLPRYLEAALVGTAQKLRFTMPAITPDRPDGVDDISGRQTIPLGQLGISGFAAAQPGAFLQQPRTGSAMNGAVHSAAAQQSIVGGIDYGIHRQSGNVSLDDFNGSFHVFLISGF